MTYVQSGMASLSSHFNDQRIGFRCLSEVYVLIDDDGNLYVNANLFQKKLVILVEDKHWKGARTQLEKELTKFHVNLIESGVFGDFLIWKQNVRQILFGSACQCCICGMDRDINNIFLHCQRCTIFKAFVKKFMNVTKDGKMSYNKENNHQTFNFRYDGKNVTFSFDNLLIIQKLCEFHAHLFNLRLAFSKLTKKEKLQSSLMSMIDETKKIDLFLSELLTLSIENGYSYDISDIKHIKNIKTADKVAYLIKKWTNSVKAAREQKKNVELDGQTISFLLKNVCGAFKLTIVQDKDIQLFQHIKKYQNI